MYKAKKIILALFFALFCVSCTKKAQTRQNISVFADIFPVYDFVRQITGDKASLHILMPAGSDPHHFDFTAADMLKLNKADIFFYCGITNPKIEKLAGTLGNSTITVDLCKNYRGDPHIWLDFEKASVMTEGIFNTLSESDRESKEFYLTNLHKFKKQMRETDLEYGNVLSACKVKTIIYMGHSSFSRLAEKYGLGIVSLTGTFHGGEPAAKDMANIMEYIKVNDLHYVFTDIFLNPKLARTIAEGTNAKILTLNPMGTVSDADFDAGKDYITMIRENLDSLSKGLECKK